MPLDQWVYVPRNALNWIPWAVGIAVSVLLACVGMTSIKLPQVAASRIGVWVAALIGIAIMSGFLLWKAMQPQFLTLATMAKPLASTYAFMVVICLVIFGIGVTATGQARLAVSDGRLIDTLQLATQAMCAVLGAFGVSAILRHDDSGAGKIRSAHDSVLRYVRSLENKTISPPDFDLLKEALDALSKSDRTNLYYRGDERLAAEWVKAASTLRKLMGAGAPSDYFNSGEERQLEGTMQIDILRKNI